MTPEQKELLLKDLCARLKYDVKLSYRCNHIHILKGIHKSGLIVINDIVTNISTTTDVENITSYLFPMSSMTEEQKEEALPLLNNCDYYTIDGVIKWLDNHPIKFFDWCDKNHFDYRGLIPIGLAIDATNLNIY